MGRFRSLKDEYPELAVQWHPTKNGSLMPDQVSAGSGKVVWWKYQYDDPETGMHHDFEWKASVINRAHKGNGCPYLSGKAAWPGYNDLATTNPALASEWHPTKNGSLTPEQVTAGSEKVVWWKHPYDDPETGLHHEFEWKAQIASRAKNGCGCPYLSGRAVWPGYNDLATTNPALASEWHPTKNGNLTPERVTAGSHRIVWWRRPYDDPKTGQHYEFEWKGKIVNRGINRNECPYLSGQAVWPGYNDLATLAPGIASELYDVKNHGIKAEDIIAYSERKLWWRCSKCGHIWRAAVDKRVSRGSGCPHCLQNRKKYWY